MKNPITRIENSTCHDKVSPEFKKKIDSQFAEKVSPLREERIKQVQAQVQPVSAITPKQPITQQERPIELNKKKKEPKGDFAEQLREKIEYGSMDKEATIVEENGKYCVKSHTGKNLGCSDTHEGAVKRLRQVEFFKHQGQVNPQNEEKIHQTFYQVSEALKNSGLSRKEIVDLLGRVQDYYKYSSSFDA